MSGLQGIVLGVLSPWSWHVSLSLVVDLVVCGCVCVCVNRCRILVVVVIGRTLSNAPPPVQCIHGLCGYEEQHELYQGFSQPPGALGLAGCPACRLLCLHEFVDGFHAIIGCHIPHPWQSVTRVTWFILRIPYCASTLAVASLDPLMRCCCPVSVWICQFAWLLRQAQYSGAGVSEGKYVGGLLTPGLRLVRRGRLQVSVAGGL